MENKIVFGKLNIDKTLFDFITHEALPQTGVSEEQFWGGFERIISELAPRNKELLQKRDALQYTLDEWFKDRRDTKILFQEQQNFLRSIGYLVEQKKPTPIQTLHVDPEISSTAAPQLVVPADNARYVLNAANARWGSLLDVLYGTDMVDVEKYPKSDTYNPQRGAKVFGLVYDFLDKVAPLESGCYAKVSAFSIVKKALIVTLDSGEQTQLREPEKCVGYTLNENMLASVLLCNHGLHVEICIDANSFIGKSNQAGIKDVILESALSAIVDCEDSVAAVDAEDKVDIYRNWNGLMRGDLETHFENKGKKIHRTLNPDKIFRTLDGNTLSLKGRVLLLIRNVGIHMYTDAITYNVDGIPEGFLDAFVTTLCAMHDIQKTSGIRNSVEKSVYIVKPKCHGPEEIAFVDTLFKSVEDVLGLPLHTIKMGIMDEERRTSANLQACIEAAGERVFFINTGFLDRTGDEIHSMMEYAPVVPKEEIKKEVWLGAYEDQNVDVGLVLGFQGKAQIGKGMWTMPDAMKKMVEVKIAHPLSGATTAWVPSPTAATLHALHYHSVDVRAQQEHLLSRQHASLEALLTPPSLDKTLTAVSIKQEIENNIQSILGYVVRWVDQGIGCSKVPDINNVELMEDRATLRISSQHLANWLHHKIVSQQELSEAFEKMALVVDAQNKNDKKYKPMAPEFSKSVAYQAACDLVFKGRHQPNGYTEFILHARRKEAKASL